jgi:hypothetical protein
VSLGEFQENLHLGKSLSLNVPVLHAPRSALSIDAAAVAASGSAEPARRG